MRRILLLAISLVMIASAAFASHIAIFSDATGSICNLASGFSTGATILHKFSAGSVGSRFRVDLSLCPGSTILEFNSPYLTTGTITSDESVAYGQCLSGSIVVGTLTALWFPGAVSIVPAAGFPDIIDVQCDLVEVPATGGHTSIDGDGHGCDEDAVEPSTWSSVKALYR